MHLSLTARRLSGQKMEDEYYLEPAEVDEFLEWAQIYQNGVLIDGEFYEFGDKRIRKLWLARQTKNGTR